MTAAQYDIIAQLRKDILPMQGLRSVLGTDATDAGLSVMKNAFPNACFPLGAMHEFISHTAEDGAATSGFVAGILSSLMRKDGVSIWISAAQTIFPPALTQFGIAPDRMIFISLKKEKEAMWAMEESLKCGGLSAVIGEIPELSFTASRRLQLAVEKSRVTGFLLRKNPRSLSTTACVSRWKITSLPSINKENLPGVGFPGWNAELLKIRNGKPGEWQLRFDKGRFRNIIQPPALVLVPQKKAG